MYINKLEYRINEEGCWICISHARDKDGFVIFKRNKKWYRIHRYMYEKRYGTIPIGEFIRHKCDNPHCINPKHLVLGRKKIKNGSIAYGEKIGSVKLTEEQVIEIYKDRITQQKELAKKYKVTPMTIGYIQRDKSWIEITSKIRYDEMVFPLSKKERKRQYQGRYINKNREKVKEYHRNYEKLKRNKNSEYIIRKRLRNSLRTALKNYSKEGKVKKSGYYGIDYEAIIDYLKPLPENLNDYDIHHKRPLFTFDLTNQEEIKEAFSPKNHELISTEEHRKIDHHRRTEAL